MALYWLAADEARPIPQATFAELGLRERADIQRLLRDRPEVLVPERSPGSHDLYIVAEEYTDWVDSTRRIDLLAIDQDARLVVVELKRTDDGGHMELQAIRYAAMVSALTFTQLVNAHQRYLDHRGIAASARERLLDFLQIADETQVVLQSAQPAIILAAADFSREVTTTVLWLRDQGIDIRCVRLRPYQFNGATLLDASQVIPLPEAESYLVQLRERVAEVQKLELPDQAFAEEDFQRLAAELTNPSVRAIFTECSKRPGEWISFSEMLTVTGATHPQLRAALAGLTMWVKRRFERGNWPIDSSWSVTGDGQMHYRLDSERAAWWRRYAA